MAVYACTLFCSSIHLSFSLSDIWSKFVVVGRFKCHISILLFQFFILFCSNNCSDQLSTFPLVATKNSNQRGTTTKSFAENRIKWKKGFVDKTNIMTIYLAFLHPHTVTLPFHFKQFLSSEINPTKDWVNISQKWKCRLWNCYFPSYRSKENEKYFPSEKCVVNNFHI